MQYNYCLEGDLACFFLIWHLWRWRHSAHKSHLPRLASLFVAHSISASYNIKASQKHVGRAVQPLQVQLRICLLSRTIRMVVSSDMVWISLSPLYWSVTLGCPWSGIRLAKKLHQNSNWPTGTKACV